MSSIYGWFSVSKSAPSPGMIDSQRNASKCLTATSPRVACQHKRAELGGHGSNAAPAIYQSERILAIIDGTPQWQDSALATLAKQQGDAHALAEGFLRDGRAVLNKISGPFACCLIAPENHYALLAVDRLGIRPLAFYWQNGHLIFGSQLDQIAARPDVKVAVDPQAIFNYLYAHIIPSPETIYQGIAKLQPAECLEISNGQIDRQFYWQRPYHDSPLPKTALLAQLHTELEQATALCLPDQHTGAFLSGGLDSSTVVGKFQKLMPHPIDAFTIGFDAAGYDEMEYARITAKHFNVKLHEYYVTPADVLHAIPLIAKTYDEPFGNASAIPAYYCAKLAKEQGMTKLLAGDGGDEIFAGNARYAKQKLFDFYRYIPGIAKSILEPLAANIPPLRKVKSYIDQANIPMPERLETYNFLHRTPLTEIFSGDFLRQVNPNLPLQNLHNTYQHAATDDLVKRMLFLDNKFTLADNDLRKVNRMCELAGVDVRYPMLQENLVDFAATIPSNWLMQGIGLRSFYRAGMKGFLPDATLAKSKQGFGLPFGVWMSTDKDLKDFAEANLQSIANRDFLNPAYIKKLLQLHQSGDASYYGVMIWLLIMLEQWLSTH
ncbi:MAG: asparagine synthase-related protein [Methylovulum sp.]|nr:asparagine synthase-related protein [Methylovulum sp.]